ncbi:histidine phosphatase family protein [Sinorhizobium meliloti]|uniref:histidine phosphatase family protein n=1 Tax=Rhizobium meliloti TaxID=382 RepID=UPI000FD28D1A|nr:histidine phosphatase family protein [Sinorhizobium meliloti]RVI15478.1 histidine phosphatase family protein [Sinorhizobium meliloti]RVN84746.1 histidine phosphatase family protein [Sinorhizobium meliloti]RVO11693.1 histidine phosphatase family protein [Sinorhizobium meliloti]
MKRIILVRHGESAWNSVRRLQGQADIGLSARGEAQATALRATIEAMRPDHVIASDLLRARHTAALLGYPHAQLSPALREIDVGDWTGRAIGDLMAEDQDAYLGWRAGTYAPRGGERWQEFRDRVTAGLGKAVSIPGERLLVVCHGGVIRALLDGLLGLPPKRIIPVGPASVTVLAHKPGGMRLETFNFSPDGPVFDAPD